MKAKRILVSIALASTLLLSSQPSVFAACKPSGNTMICTSDSPPVTKTPPAPSRCGWVLWWYICR